MIVFNYNKWKNDPVIKKVFKDKNDMSFEVWKHNEMRQLHGNPVIFDREKFLGKDEVYISEIGRVFGSDHHIYREWCDEIPDEPQEEDKEITVVELVTSKPFWVMLPIFTGISLTAYCITMTVMSIIDKVVI